mmetsp:Transcript_40654/g.105543  ORF Transcript_40654/g.105543 Transcript_40654/m.105543 type:complete len:91 (+) Transcript_40654:308-580(+)
MKCFDPIQFQPAMLRNEHEMFVATMSASALGKSQSCQGKETKKGGLPDVLQLGPAVAQSTSAAKVLIAISKHNIILLSTGRATTLADGDY